MSYNSGNPAVKLIASLVSLAAIIGVLALMYGVASESDRPKLAREQVESNEVSTGNASSSHPNISKSRRPNREVTASTVSTSTGNNRNRRQVSKEPEATVDNILKTPEKFVFDDENFRYVGGNSFFVSSRSEVGIYRNFAALTTTTGCIISNAGNADTEWDLTTKDLMIVSCEWASVGDWVKSNHPEHYEVFTKDKVN